MARNTSWCCVLLGFFLRVKAASYSARVRIDDIALVRDDKPLSALYLFRISTFQFAERVVFGTLPLSRCRIVSRMKERRIIDDLLEEFGHGWWRHNFPFLAPKNIVDSALTIHSCRWR